MISLRRIFFFAALSIRCRAPATGRGTHSQPPEFVGIRVGFGGHYKVGLWTPVELSLRGGSETVYGQVTATVNDSDGIPVPRREPREPCQSASSQRRDHGDALRPVRPQLTPR